MLPLYIQDVIDLCLLDHWKLCALYHDFAVLINAGKGQIISLQLKANIAGLRHRIKDH